MRTVSIPVMAKARIGHFAEAQILQALGVDMIDESEGKHVFYYSETGNTLLCDRRFLFSKIVTNRGCIEDSILHDFLLILKQMLPN